MKKSIIMLLLPLIIAAFTSVYADVVQIGSGTADLDLPINAYYGYTYSQSIFQQNEINVPNQRIESVYYYWNGVAEAVASNDWTIYMGHTAATEFASATDWLPLANLTQVFTGTVVLPATAGWIEIPLTTPFRYNNTDNLVIAVDENSDSYDGSDEFFYCTGSGTNRSICYYSDGTNPDPATPPAGTLVLGFPKVMLAFGDIPFGVDPPVVTAGINLLGQPVLNWAAVPGANAYHVYGLDEPYEPEPWTLLGTVAIPGFTYTGTEAKKFFVVRSDTDASATRASSDVISAPANVTNRIAIKAQTAPKGYFHIKTHNR